MLLEYVIPNREIYLEKITLHEGNRYLLSNEDKLNIYKQDRDFLHSTNCIPFENNKPKPTSWKDFEGKKLFIINGKGYGDSVFIARSVQEIKQRTDCDVTLIMDAQYVNPISSMFKQFDNVLSFPIEENAYKEADYYFYMPHTFVGNEDCKTVNAFELAAKKLCIDLTGPYTTQITLNQEEIEAASYTSSNGKVVAIHVAPSALNRTYPQEMLKKLVKCLIDKDFHVLLLGAKEQRDEFVNILDSLYRIILPQDSSLVHSVALLSRCDLLIAPDSFFVYVADSFKIPVIAYYSNVDSALRCKRLNVIAIETMGRCHNCYVHNGLTDFPCIFSSDDYSPCLKSIKPELLLELVRFTNISEKGRVK